MNTFIKTKYKACFYPKTIFAQFTNHLNQESSNFGNVAMTIHKYFRELVRDLFEVEIPDLTITNIKLLINELDKEDKKPSGGKRKNSGESGQFCLAEIFLL